MKTIYVVIRTDYDADDDGELYTSTTIERAFFSMADAEAHVKQRMASATKYVDYDYQSCHLVDATELA